MGEVKAHPVEKVLDTYRGQNEALETILASLEIIRLMKPAVLFHGACDAVIDPIFSDYIVPISEKYPAVLTAALIGMEKTAARAQIAQRYQEFKDPEQLRKELDEEADDLDADDILAGFDDMWEDSVGDTEAVINGFHNIGESAEEAAFADLETWLYGSRQAKKELMQRLKPKAETETKGDLYAEEPALADLETWFYGSGKERTALMKRLAPLMIYPALLTNITALDNDNRFKRQIQVSRFRNNVPKDVLQHDLDSAKTERQGNWTTFVWDFGVMENHFGWPPAAINAYVEALGNIDMFNLLDRVKEGGFSYEQHLAEFMSVAAELAYRTLDEHIVGPFVSSHRILETNQDIWYNSLKEIGPLARTTPSMKEIIDHPLEYLQRLEAENGEADFSTEGSRIEMDMD